jgi:hypothetical protein
MAEFFKCKPHLGRGSPMRMAINKIKWFAVSVSALSLLMVFWVWPAWNGGSQSWYLANDGNIDTSPMYRNQHPPPGLDDFVFATSFDHRFTANEAATMMLNFGTDPWQFHIEWWRETGMDTSGFITDNLNWELTIGRLKGMTSMFESFFTAMGSSPGPGSMEDPVVISGSTMSLGRSLYFEMGDMLAAMLTLSSMTMGGNFHVVLKNTCYITSPLSDPGYPGEVPIPTLSQWGMLLFAALIAVFSLFVMRRRVRMGCH